MQKTFKSERNIPVRKTLSCIGLIFVLSILGSIQTATAFERNARESHVSREPRQSEEHSSQGKSGSGLRESPGRREVRSHRPARYEHRLPTGYRTLKTANRILYYLNGIFYQPTSYGYEIVNAPMGAIIGELPPGYYQILYGGTTYYVYNNTYYVQAPVGYSVVTPPSPRVMFPAQTGW